MNPLHKQQTRHKSNKESDRNHLKTKKKNVNKTQSQSRLGTNPKSSKTSIKIERITTQEEGNKNNILVKENKHLRNEFWKLQQVHLKDKEKIKILIGRISEIKTTQQTRSETPEKNKNICENAKCLERRKRLELDLVRHKNKVNELEKQKSQWLTHKQKLKNKYVQLLSEIQTLKLK